MIKTPPQSAAITIMTGAKAATNNPSKCKFLKIDNRQETPLMVKAKIATVAGEKLLLVFQAILTSSTWLRNLHQALRVLTTVNYILQIQKASISNANRGASKLKPTMIQIGCVHQQQVRWVSVMLMRLAWLTRTTFSSLPIMGSRNYGKQKALDS